MIKELDSYRNSTGAPAKAARLDEIAKRFFDFLVALLGLLLLSPVFGIIALATKRDSPGPVFYWGARVGLKGKLFKILKFRTMYETPESYEGPRITARNDPRITSFGQWLRDTKLNEIPQLWNVLVGEMSMVGPRPEDPEIVEKWPKDIREEVLSIRPGITSPASIHYHNEESMLTSKRVMQTYLEKISPTKLRMDLLYVRNRSFWVDLDVIMWTVLVLVPKLRSLDVPDELIFWGPMSRFVRRYLNWFSIDTFLSLLAWAITWLIAGNTYHLDIRDIPILGVSLGYACLFSLIGLLFGLNRISWSKAKASDVTYVIAAWGIATSMVLLINRLLFYVPNGFLILASSLVLIGFIGFRYRSRLLTGFLYRLRRLWNIESSAREKVIIVGAGKTGEIAARLLDNPTVSNIIQVVGFVDDNFDRRGMRIYGIEVIGRLVDLPGLIKKDDIGIVIYMPSHADSDEYQRVLALCGNTQAQLMFLPDIVSFLESVIMAGTFQYAQYEIKKQPESFLNGLENPPCKQCLIHYAIDSGDGRFNEGEQKERVIGV